MFEAYSQSKHRIVNVTDEFDLNEIFLCPNPQCNARLTLRSVNGKKAKHFGRLKSSPHCGCCPYDHSQQSYVNSNHIVKYPIDAIFNGISSQKAIVNSPSNTKLTPKNLSDTKYNFVRTPKQLYYFCISNALDTPYTDTLTVGDVVLDSRNLLHNANFHGVSGVRLIIAETIKYSVSEQNIKLRLYQRTVHGKLLSLTVTVYLNQELLKGVVNYIMETHGKFSGYNVAILGNWFIDEKYHISCTLKNKNHLLLRL